MMVLCINISRIVLHILRDNLLDKMVKDADNVWEVANKLYTGVVLHIYHIWKTQVISTIELVITYGTILIFFLSLRLGTKNVTV